jgi:hypothetical protein
MSKSVTHLPQNLQDVFAEVSKHADGIPLKSLRVGKMSTKYRSWMVRQLAKHEFLRVKAEEKPEPRLARAKACAAIANHCWTKLRLFKCGLNSDQEFVQGYCSSVKRVVGFTKPNSSGISKRLPMPRVFRLTKVTQVS